MSRRGEILVLLGVLALAAAIRLSGIRWGLPHPYHPDEGSILFHALAFGTGDLNPHWFRWPSLGMYEMFGVYGVYFVAGRLAGTFSGSSDLVRQYLTDLTPFWLMGRLASAVAGVATVWVTWLIGRRAYNRFVGVVAAAVLAVVYLHVRDSHYATPDVLTTFLASVSLLFAVNACGGGRSRSLMVSALFAGLAASAKYPGGIAGVGTVAAFFYLWSRREVAFGTIVGIAILGLVGFVAGTPFSVLSFGEFRRDIVMQYTMVSTAYGPVFQKSFSAGLAEMLGGTLARGVGLPVLALTLVGFFVPTRVWEDAGGDAGDRASGAAAGSRIVLVAYVLAILVVMALLTVKRSTYLTPALPAVALLAAAGLSALFFRRDRRGGLGLATVAAVVLVVVTAMPSLRFTRALGAEDTRTLAKRWVESNIPAGESIAVETYGPVLHPTTEQLRMAMEESDTAVETWEGPKRALAELKLDIGRSREPQYRLYGIDWGEDAHRLPGPWEAPDELAGAIEDHGIRYVILTSKAEQYRPMDDAEPPFISVRWAFNEWLTGNARVVERFVADEDVPPIDRGAGRSFHNPVIEVYEIVGNAGTASDAGGVPAGDAVDAEAEPKGVNG